MPPMAKLCLPALLALLLVPLALSAGPPQIPPSPSPELTTGAPPPEAGAPKSSPPFISPAGVSHISSPPAPPPSGSAPAPSPVSSPAPSPSNSTRTRHAGVAVADEDAGDGGGSSGGGLSSTKKAGIVAGVIVLVGVVVLGGLVYKRRKDNIRRSQYSYAARREIL